MAKNEYIAAIEIGSSRISGAIGIHTTAGTRVLAYASEPSSNYVSKGVIRNVDEASKSLNSLINRLEEQMENVHIKKAYISFSCMSIHSIVSKVTKNFDTYTKITQEVINEMQLENEQTFKVPEGYKKLQVVAQEYKLNGDTTTTPIGTPTQKITCNYLNIIAKEQYIRQLEDCFVTAKIDITDSFNTARLEAEYILSEDDLNCGAAIVSIGAETTTVAIYSNKTLCKLTVIPLGSANITRDICNEQINTSEAEKIKIFKGYGSTADSDCLLSPDEINNIISGRMSEILKNAQYQIENSGYNIGRIIFTGGGSKLINFSTIIEEVLPNYRYRIATDVEPPYDNEESVSITKGSITPALFVMLSNGETNCCSEEVLAPLGREVEGDLFSTQAASATQTTNETQAVSVTQTTSATQDTNTAQVVNATQTASAMQVTSTTETTSEAQATGDTHTTSATETTDDEQTDSEVQKNRDHKQPSLGGRMKTFFEEWFKNEVISDENNRVDRDDDEL